MTITLNVNINLPSELSRYFEDLQKNIGILIQGQKRMADVLDQIAANETLEEQKQEEVLALVKTQQDEITALQNGQISATDPRFQTVLATQQKVLSAFGALLASQNPPTGGQTDPPPPAGDPPTV